MPDTKKAPAATAGAFSIVKRRYEPPGRSGVRVFLVLFRGGSGSGGSLGFFLFRQKLGSGDHAAALCLHLRLFQRTGDVHLHVDADFRVQDDADVEQTQALDRVVDRDLIALDREARAVTASEMSRPLTDPYSMPDSAA